MSEDTLASPIMRKQSLKKHKKTLDGYFTFKLFCVPTLNLKAVVDY